jgi:hypothetical protein
MSREELLKREDEAWSELVATIVAVPSDRLDVEGVVPGWSIHDLVWHCAYWAAYASDRLERSHGGELEPEEREGEDAGEAEILTTGRGMEWDEVMLKLEQNRERARAAIGDLPDVRWTCSLRIRSSITRSTRPKSGRSASDPATSSSNDPGSPFRSGDRFRDRRALGRSRRPIR